MKDYRLGDCFIGQGVRRFQHVQFWEIKLEPDCDLDAMELCLRKLITDASQQCKKIEIFAADKNTAHLVERLGFHYRGKKTGSCKIEDNYYDEIGVDLSFFNIQDARELLTLYATHEYQQKRILSALKQCQEAIRKAFSEKQVDSYSALYLENMAFQMIREGLGEPAIRRYGQKNQEPQPWHALIAELPRVLKEDFIHLEKLTTKSVNESVAESSHRKDVKKGR